MRHVFIRNRRGELKDTIVPSIHFIRVELGIGKLRGHRLTEIRQFGRFRGFRCSKCNTVYTR